MVHKDNINSPLNADEIVQAAATAWANVASTGGTKPAAATEFHLASADQRATSTSIVTLSLPGIPIEATMDWVGPRLVLWRNGITNLHRISIVSSRIGKRKDLKRWWFDALRTAVIRCDTNSDTLCYVDGTSTSTAVARASELFGVKRLRLEIKEAEPVSTEELAAWLTENHQVEQTQNSELESTAILSPPLKSVVGGDHRGGGDIPITDSLLALAGQRIIAISRRAGGNVDALISQNLNDVRLNATVFLASVPDADAAPIPQSLIDRGAVPWILDRRRSDTPDPDDGSPNSVAHTESVVGPTVTSPSPLTHPDQWLCHWTRPRYGPWSDQDDDEFWDELILGCSTADRSAIAALLRIVQQKTIISSHSVQDSPPTVSFTAVPLAGFRNRRIFRKHKQRHDFEPWGVAIRKSDIKALGGQPVTYVDDPDERLSSADRTFLQPRCNVSRSIDWSTEQEWRVRGDVDLAKLPSDAVMIFVDSVGEQKNMQQLSPWQVIQTPATP